MNRLLSLRRLNWYAARWYLLAVVLGLALLFYNWLRVNYEECRVDHRKGFHLLTPVELVRDACWIKRNPFYW